MALSDRVTERISTQRLVELTNPQDRSATSIDTTRLGFAAQDAAAEFQVRTGVSYDDTNAVHILACVQGVIYHLHLFAGQSKTATRQAKDLWDEMLEKVKSVTGNNRILPTDNSNLTPSREDLSGGPVEPKFDRNKMDPLRIRPPRRT